MVAAFVFCFLGFCCYFSLVILPLKNCTNVTTLIHSTVSKAAEPCHPSTRQPTTTHLLTHNIGWGVVVHTAGSNVKSTAQVVISSQYFWQDQRVLFCTYQTDKAKYFQMYF